MRLLPFALWAMLALAGSRAAPGQTLSDSVRDRLRDRVAQEPAALRRLYEGRASYPAAIDTDWSAAAGRSEATRAVAEGLDSWRLPSLLESLAPPYPAYGRLRLALAHYRNIAALGGWPAVPGGAVLAAADPGAGVPAIRTRLAGDGDL